MPRIIVILFGLAVCFFPAYVNPLNRLLGIDVGLEGPASILLWNWLAVGGLLAFVHFVDRQPISSILIKRPNAKDIETALFYWGIAMAWSWLAMTLLPPEQDAGTAALVALSIPVLLAMILTTATTEEILFRGYPIERINELTSSVWIGPAVSFTIFLIPHLTFFSAGLAVVPRWRHGHDLCALPTKTKSGRLYASAPSGELAYPDPGFRSPWLKFAYLRFNNGSFWDVASIRRRASMASQAEIHAATPPDNRDLHTGIKSPSAGVASYTPRAIARAIVAAAWA